MKRIENINVNNTKPTTECVIADSGVIPLDKPFFVEKKPVRL